MQDWIMTKIWNMDAKNNVKYVQLPTHSALIFVSIDQCSLSPGEEEVSDSKKIMNLTII